MTGVDRAWLRMDEPSNLMIINGVMVFEGKVERASFVKKLEDRLLRVDRFRHRIVQRGRRHYWEEVPDFDLDDHLVFEQLLGEDPEAELQHLVARHMAVPLSYDRPLWRLHVIEGYEDSTALLWRIHHSVGDGIALMLTMLAMTDAEPAPPEDVGNPLSRLFTDDDLDHEEAKAHLARALPQAVTLLTRPSEILASTSALLRGLASVPALGRLTFRSRDNPTIFKGPVGVQKRVAWSRAVPLELVERLRDGFGGTVNDVLLTATAGGLRRYMASRRSEGAPSDFRAVVPVSLRPLEEMASMGNQFGLVFLSLPVAIEDPEERHRELRARMDRLKRSYEPAVVLNLLRLFGSTAKSIQDLALRIFGSKATAVLTSVPGPCDIVYFCGRPIRRLFFWVPQAARLGMGLSVISYAGSAWLGVATDASLVDRPQGIVDGFHQELELMQSRLDTAC